MIRKLFIISLIWAILIFIVCAIPGSDLPKPSFLRIPHFDKIAHAILYFPLAIFILAEFDLASRLFLKLAGPVFTMIIIAIYGGLIEICQEFIFISRSAEIADFFFDLIGGMSGILFYYLFLQALFQRLNRKRPLKTA
jgi:VanZ family protein